jgi:NitT/TauT family transport system ATP-binding protein
MEFGFRAALRDISLETRVGEILAVVGPSGCGKTTLLKLIAGLVNATEGTVTVNGVSPPSNPPGSVGFAFQRPVLFPWLTIGENVTLPTLLRNSAARPALLLEVLAQTGLTDTADLMPRQLSGGMQQRAVLARMLMQQPRLWLLDEPFASIDEISRRQLDIEVRELVRSIKATAVFVTHDIEEAILTADRIVILSSAPGIIRTVVDVPAAARQKDRYESPVFLGLMQCIRRDLNVS